MVSPINTPPTPAQTQIPVAEIQNTPQAQSPRYVPIVILVLGILTALLVSINYSGKFLLSFLTTPAKDPLLNGDVVGIPNAGFDYLHNLSKFPQVLLEKPGEYKLLNIVTGSIDILPKEIGTMSNLQTLQISDNNLKTLPDEIGNLTQLESLNFGGNKLMNIPTSISNLSHLKKLYLYNNKLASLPNGIGSLTNLEVLDIHANSLKNLPSTINGLTNLKTLYLGGNQIPKSEQQKIINSLPNTQIFF